MNLPLPDPVLDLDVCALAAALRRGDLTPLEVTRRYLTRIAAINPELRAVLTVNPEAEAEAERLEDLPAKERGVLHGVPLLIKDNVDVAGLPTTAGSLLMQEHVPAADAPLVARLRRAGAIILGKTNLTEWANFMALGMKNGYSALGGQTVNPWGAGHDTGGSSSGSGVAVIARLCAAAIGTETSGSVVSPAHSNGVIGLKPTLGLIPRTGIIPISPSQDTAGTLTRSVRDAALLLSVMAGPDDQDETSRRLPVPELTLIQNALLNLEVAVIRDEPGLSKRKKAALALAEEKLQEGGANLREVALPTRAEWQMVGWRLDVPLYEFKPALNAYLSTVTRGPRSLAEIIAGNDADADTHLRYGQQLLLAAQATRGDLTEAAYARARERDVRLARTAGLDELFARGHDLLLFPGIRGYDLAAAAGYPSLALPVALEGDKPGGILLVAPAGADGLLLSAAAHLNSLLGGVQFPPERVPE